MHQDELIDLWAAAPAASQSTEAFDIRHQLGSGYIAVSPSNTAAVIIPITDAELPRGRVLGSVRLRFDPKLSFDVEGSVWTQPAAIIDCVDVNVLSTFASVARDILAQLVGGPVHAKHVLAAITRWDELLRRRSPLTATSELGLWGELSLISRSPSPDGLVSAWRGPHGDTVDFYGNGIALECKTSPRRLQHRVSQRQAEHTGENLEAYLVSVWACEDPSGRSLSELIDDILGMVVDVDEFRRRLLVAGFQEEHRHEYTRRFHCPAEPRFFDLDSIPRVRAADDGVSNVRYDIDLTGTKSLGRADAARILSRLTTTKAP